MSNEKKTLHQAEPAKSVFVISPIGAAGSPESIRAKAVLDYIIREALTPPKWEVIRADEEVDSGSITHKVIERIATSDLIVADLTDHNPNVFYELAVAHGYDKPVVNLMTDGQRMPFDIVDQRAVFYDLTDPGSVHRAKIWLAKAAENALNSDARPTNPLAGYKLFAGGVTSTDEGAPNGGKLEYALDTIMARLSRIESEILRDPHLSGVPRNSYGRNAIVHADSGKFSRRPLPNDTRPADVIELEKLHSQLDWKLSEMAGIDDPTEDQLTEMETMRKRMKNISNDLRPWR